MIYIIDAIKPDFNTAIVTAIVTIPGLGINTPIIFKSKKFACRSLKGRGVESGIRLIYAYWEAQAKIEFIEIYFRSDKKTRRGKGYIDIIANKAGRADCHIENQAFMQTGKKQPRHPRRRLDLLAAFYVYLLSNSVFPNSRAPLRVCHPNDGNTSLSFNKKHPVGKPPRQSTPDNVFMDNRKKLRIPFD